MTGLPWRWYLLYRMCIWYLVVGFAAYLHNIDNLTGATP